MDELKADIKSYIEQQRESLKKVNAENAVFKTVVDSSSVSIPQAMIDREVESLKADYQQRLAYQGIDWNSFLQSQGEDFEKNLAIDAAIRIKNSLIIDKVSKEVDIKVEQADFQTKISQMAAAYGVTPQDLMKQFGQNPDFLSTLSQQIVNDKVRDYLLSNNNIEYVEVKSDKKAVEA